MEDKPVLSRTLGDIAKRYDERRNEILKSIRDGKISASMSGIDNYSKPWVDLDITNPVDLHTVNTMLTWDGDHHTHEGLRQLSPLELELHDRRSKLMFESCGHERERKIDNVRQQLIKEQCRIVGWTPDG